MKRTSAHVLAMSQRACQTDGASVMLTCAAVVSVEHPLKLRAALHLCHAPLVSFKRLLGGPVPTYHLPPPAISAKPTKDELNHRLTQWCRVPDLALGINTHPDDEPNHLRPMTPTQSIALATDRQVIVDPTASA